MDLLDPELIQLNMDAGSHEEIIKKLAGILMEKGYVKESYLESVLEREKRFPTGISMGEVNVAIPHTDAKHVIKTGMAIAILNNPVKFNIMDDPKNEVETKLVFMLAIKDPELQLKLLGHLASMFRNKDLLISLKEAKYKNDVIKIFESINLV
ncbi:MAG: PTS sugar transporter subunit IIA [Tepidanaerobacteraceae bacterium]|nr:PTS sugar transporter subunit IIA [Tepidanaerobacteraceae bacterium]